MKKIILVLAVAAFAFSPLLVTSASAGPVRHALKHAKHHVKHVKHVKHPHHAKKHKKA